MIGQIMIGFVIFIIFTNSDKSELLYKSNEYDIAYKSTTIVGNTFGCEEF